MADVFDTLKAAVDKYAETARGDAMTKLQAVADALNNGKLKQIEAAVKQDVVKAEGWIAANHAKIASGSVVVAAAAFVAKLLALIP